MWGAVFIIGIGTYLTRLSFIGAFGEREMPAWMEAPLRYVAPAVLGAIVLPAVVMPEGTIEFLPTANPKLLAAVIAGAVAAKWRNVSLVIAVGMSSLWLLDWVL
ncbi:MAG: AzlD domain-containing protein [Acidimicrobiia bacterium]|nr:AzlD domain-containing protein [Acidimicrobiia bacterium]MDX2466482.1 AzlD domain-containing protein [Acidimicrobiia bacterium]